jgi:transcriptional regulator with XRE-family HTH domain
MYPNLKLAIFKRGLRQSQLAKDLGISDGSLSKIIHGFREPSDGQREWLARYLDADEIWLFEKLETVSTVRLSSNGSVVEDEDNGNP